MSANTSAQCVEEKINVVEVAESQSQNDDEVASDGAISADHNKGNFHLFFFQLYLYG
jgi:hypothetical protein